MIKSSSLYHICYIYTLESHLAFDPVPRMKVGGDEAVPVIGAWQQVWVAVVGFGLGGGKGREVILVKLPLDVSGSLTSH